MENVSMFNDAALDAVAVLHGRDAMKTLIAHKTRDWLEDVQQICREPLIRVLERFASAADNLTDQGDPEKLVELVEQLRAYQPLLTFDKLEAFHKERLQFSLHLNEVDKSLREYRKGAPAVVSEYSDKIFACRLRAAEAGVFMDIVKFHSIREEWNVMAKELEKALEQALA